MSLRAIPTKGNEMVEFLRDLVHRIERIEQLAFLRGRISFDPTIQIGDVQVAVTNGVGNARILTFTNVLTGASYSINL